MCILQFWQMNQQHYYYFVRFFLVCLNRTPFSTVSKFSWPPLTETTSRRTPRMSNHTVDSFASASTIQRSKESSSFFAKQKKSRQVMFMFVGGGPQPIFIRVPLTLLWLMNHLCLSESWNCLFIKLNLFFLFLSFQVLLFAKSTKNSNNKKNNL